MTESLDRTALVELLEKLGSEKDEEVLEAARAAHGLVSAAGADWGDLLAERSAPADLDDDLDEDAAPAAVSDGPLPDDAESLALIDAIKAQPDLSEALSEELEGYREDIAEKQFEESDRKYLRALHQRLVK